jgi:uncharacterized protein
MSDAVDAARRIRPVRTLDTAWWFDGCREHRLLIQRCAGCGVPRHPPKPMCGTCRSVRWDTVESAGGGTLHSYVVVHHPKAPGYDYPHLVGLVDLAEGTRLVGDVVGIDPREARIGMPVELDWHAIDEELTLPRFRAGGPR